MTETFYATQQVRALTGAPCPSGAHLENLVLLDLLAWRDSQIPAPEVLFWRTTTNLEVDFVIEVGSRLLPIEIMATANPGYSGTRRRMAGRGALNSSWRTRD